METEQLETEPVLTNLRIYSQVEEAIAEHNNRVSDERLAIEAETDQVSMTGIVIWCGIAVGFIGAVIFIVAGK